MRRASETSPGIDRLLASGTLAGRRVGLVCNPASTDAAYRHTAQRLWQAPDLTLAALFGPQHGFRSDVQDNMVETPHARHPTYDIPVHSLYSDRREPTAAMLDGLDVLVIDLQDVGTRVYTYIYTMANCLRAAGRHGVPVVVCDRPNPIGGTQVEGPLLEPGRESFVGQFPIPLRHGMTIGELARLFNDHFGLGAQLRVARLDGWERPAYHDATGLPWVMPSPNLPTLDSAGVYPGAVLFEGTNLSEGRGTTRPFELLGAPWIDGEALAGRAPRRGRRAAGGRGPGRALRADLPEACRPALRRLPDPRDRPRDLQARADGSRRAAGDPARKPGAVRLARAALRVRADEAADRHPRRVGRAGPADRRGRAGNGDCGRVGSGRRGVRRHPLPLPALLTAGRQRRPAMPQASDGADGRTIAGETRTTGAAAHA